MAGTTAVADENEGRLNDRDFRFIQKLVGDRTGIVLSEAKRHMVYGRLTRRLRQLGLDSVSEYCELLKANDEQELIEFTNAITTNLTSFFREPHHFEHLQTTLLPALIRNRPNKRLRIWSAGCSSGEEPYSIAMTLLDHVPGDWDVKILATDLDYNVVEQGAKGIYPLQRVEALPKPLLKRWVKRGKGDRSQLVKMAAPLQEVIHFRQLNLLHEWPFKGPFDFIFCRNVVIYFNKDTQKVLFDRFADLLADDGHLFIGHSESLYKVSTRFELLGRTIYRKAK